MLTIFSVPSQIIEVGCIACVDPGNFASGEGGGRLPKQQPLTTFVCVCVCVCVCACVFVCVSVCLS